MLYNVMQMIYIISKKERVMESTTINVRVDKKLKSDCERIFGELGLGMTAAITVYLKAVARKNGMPFPLEIPNETTLEAFKEVEDISSGKKKAKRYANASDLRKDLGV